MKGLLFCLCFTPFFASATPWIYQDSKDEMRGTSTYAAMTSSVNSREFSFPYNGGSKLRILLVSPDDKTVSAAGVSLEKGQVYCGVENKCQINVKFDNGAIQEFSASKTENSNNTLLIRESESFAESLRISNSVIIEVPVFQEGDQQFRFELEPSKFQSSEPNKPYISEIWGISLTDKMNLAGKDAEVNERGLACYQQKIQVLDGWEVNGRVCEYDNMIALVSFKSPFDHTKLSLLMKDINASIGSNVKFSNGGAAWLGGDGMKMNSLFVFANKKEGIDVTFTHDPALIRIPTQKK